ncbi:interleukin-9 receptor-like [Pristis pectinata]|uniref:interleukin-9 receptor-like n=1 Tax=Pristis pectinata TaxID=685728 RepID=UPI00223E1451|nr:interleukin-9 receptor-like [Pristis pectinata]
MASGRMRFIFLPLLCFTVKAQHSNNLDCHVDYIETMNCTWTETSNDSYVTLQVHRSEREEIMNQCTMTRVQSTLEKGRLHTYFCMMKFKFFAQHMMYDLIVNTSSQANISAVKDFRPSCNIQLKAPYHLSVTKNSTTQNVNISWQITEGRYLRNKLEYQLEYWSKETKEDVKLKKRVNDIRHLIIEEAELEPDSEYRARVRGKPIDSLNIQGTWSKWSAEIKWRTDPGSSNLSKKNNLLFVVFAPLLLAIIIFISLYFKLPSRVVGKVWIHIPNPASYFQPLYNQHNGNFKEWIHKDHASDWRYSRGESSQELREVKKVSDSTAVAVILNPWDETVSNISSLKPIPVNHTLLFDLDTKSNLQTESSNSFHHTQLLEYCNSDSVLDGLLPLMLQEEQHMSENWTLCQEPSPGTFLGTVPQEEDGGYSYSDEYCTLAHSDSSQGLVPAKIGLQLKVANKCLEEKREMAEGLPMTDNGSILPSECPATTQKSQFPQEVCASGRPCKTPLQSQTPAEPSGPPLNNEQSSLTLTTSDNSAVPSMSSDL